MVYWRPPPSSALNDVHLVNGVQSPPQHIRYHTTYARLMRRSTRRPLPWVSSSTRSSSMHSFTSPAGTTKPKCLNFKGSTSCNPKYDVDCNHRVQIQMLRYSLNNYPYLSLGPFTGVCVSPAAHAFIYRLMTNRSAEHPGSFGQEHSEIRLLYWRREPRSQPRYWEDFWQLLQACIPRRVANPNGRPRRRRVLLDIPCPHDWRKHRHSQHLRCRCLACKPHKRRFNFANLLVDSSLMCFALQFAAQADLDIIKGLFSNADHVLNLLSGLYLFFFFFLIFNF